MKKVWILEKLDTNKNWTFFLGSNNYYTFCGKVIKTLRNEDKAAVTELKESLGSVVYSEEIKTKFKELHDFVRSSFRVIAAEINEDTTLTEKTPYTNSVVNEGVYRYLWSAK